MDKRTALKKHKNEDLKCPMGRLEDDLHVETRLKSCWKMLWWNWNLNMSEDNSGESAAKENKLLKTDSPKTLKSQNVKLNKADTNR